MPPLKVCHVLLESLNLPAPTSLMRGGGVQNRLLFSQLKDYEPKVEITILVRQEHRKFYKKYENLVSKIICLPSGARFTPRLAWKITRYSKEFGWDICHGHCGRTHTLLYLASFFGLKAKIVIHRRIATTLRTRFFTKKKYLSPRISMFISVSKACDQKLSDLGVSSQRRTVIKDGVLDHYSKHSPGLASDVRKSWAAQLSKMSASTPHFTPPPPPPHLSSLCWVLCAAAFTPEKGHDFLLKTWEQYFASQPTPVALLLLAGEGEEKERLRLKYAHLPSVVFLGWVDGEGDGSPMNQLYRAADIFVLPSLTEGLGSALVEAALARCALCGREVGGIPEVIDHGKNGYLFSQGKELATYLTGLIDSPKKRELFGTQARANALMKFSAHKVVSETFRVYSDLMKDDSVFAE